MQVRCLLFKNFLAMLGMVRKIQERNGLWESFTCFVSLFRGFRFCLQKKIYFL